MAQTQSKWRKHLNSLKSMGFKFPDNVLIRHLETFEGNMSSVIEKLVQDMKHIKIKPQPKPKVVKENKNYEWWLFPILCIIVLPVIVSLLIQAKNAFYDAGNDALYFDNLDYGESVLSDTYNILWVTNSNKNTIIQHHFATNNKTLAQTKCAEYELKYGVTNVFCPELDRWCFSPKSENVMNFALDEISLVNQPDFIIHLSKDKQNEPVVVEYGTHRTPSWHAANNSIFVWLSEYNNDIWSHDINDIDVLFDLIIEAKERDILIDISTLNFVLYIKDGEIVTIVQSLNKRHYSDYSYIEARSGYGGYVYWSMNAYGLNHNAKLKLVEYWLTLEEKLQKIQGNMDKNVSVLNWLRKQLLNDKQINDYKISLFMYYLHFMKDIKNAYDLAVFREILLDMMNENSCLRMKRELMKEMRFKNVKEMKLFIQSVIVYMYEMPLWIVGKYECLKYNNSIYQNDYHFVEILHDRSNVGNYIWKTKIGQIWALEKMEGELLKFNVGKDSNYYGFNRYTEMSFVMDESEYKVHAAIGQEFEKYSKQSEL